MKRYNPAFGTIGSQRIQQKSNGEYEYVMNMQESKTGEYVLWDDVKMLLNRLGMFLEDDEIRDLIKDAKRH